MGEQSKVFIAGHNVMVGSSLVSKLRSGRFQNLLTADRSELNLKDEVAVRNCLNLHKPDYVILAAARMGECKRTLTRAVFASLVDGYSSDHMKQYLVGSRSDCLPSSIRRHPRYLDNHLVETPWNRAIQSLRRL